MKTPVVVLILALAAAGSGCDRKAPKVTAPVAPAAVGNVREEAAALARRGDWGAAEKKYREALKAQPEDTELHFGLGAVLSQLDRRDEAATEFRWVLVNGRPGTPEVDTARRWLMDVGKSASITQTTSAPAAGTAATGTVAGKLTWPDLPPEKEFGIRIMVIRDGDDRVRKFARTKLNGSFTVADLPEGAYKLTGLAGPVRIWSDVPITVSAGRQTTVDLSPANAVVSAAEFPARIR